MSSVFPQFHPKHPGVQRVGPVVTMPGVIPLVEASEALSPDELAVADRVARRLHDALRGLVESVPSGSRHASGLARHLGIDRTTCQRAVFVATRPYPGPVLLSRLPGIRALVQLDAAARAARPTIEKGITDDLTAAVAQFHSTIRVLGGSQTGLVRRLSASAGRTRLGEPDHEAGSARRRLFEAARELTGRSSECWVAVYVYRPITDDRRSLELVRANGLIGHTARAGAVPLTFHSFSTRPHAPGDDGPSAPRVGPISPLVAPSPGATGPGGLLLPFTTDPPPFVSSKQPSEFLVQAIDEPPVRPGESGGAITEPIDLMFGLRNSIPHPALQRPAVEEAWALINFPCERLVFDVYLHRDLARGCIPSLDAHLWRPDFAQNIGDRWQTRFASSPTLNLLGGGLRNAATESWPRHAELSRYVFDAAGASPAEYVGFRCEVEYPIWRAGYCVSLDFTEPQDQAEGPLSRGDP